MLPFVVAACGFAAPLSASWCATDGYRQQQQRAADEFISFDEETYLDMTNDPARTPVFAAAIEQALRGREGELGQSPE